MPLRLHNTLTGRVEPFVPLDPDRVTFYSCGPTVYDYAHIGNFRSFLAADVLRRWLESPLCVRVDAQGRPVESGPGGYTVRHVMNITDVGHMVDDSGADGAGEDKMDAASRRLLEAKKAGTLPPDAGPEFDPADPYAVAEFYARAFVRDGLTLGIRVVEEAQQHPELLPRPTRFIRPMLEMVLSLIERGHAYIGADGVAYFDTQSFPPYGRLSGNTIEKIRSGAGGRVAQSTQAVKKHPADFMLWKPDPTHLMRWDPSEVLGRQTPLKEGYPGWHLECSAMARELLGEVIDLHSGGEDNIFPHHECEIAQSCCAHGSEFFARYWFHPRFLQVEGAKMSKSKGNFYTISDLTGRGFDPAAIRLELIKTHYRSNANFTEQGLKDSARLVERWRRFASPSQWEGAGRRDTLDIHSLGPGARAAAAAFASAMDDDVNISGAIGAMNTWMNSVPSPSGDDIALVRIFDGVLGVLALKPAPAAGGGRSEEDAHIDDLVRRRTEARRSKNWAEADRIRDELAALSVVVEDTPEGPKWSRRAAL